MSFKFQPFNNVATTSDVSRVYLGVPLTPQGPSQAVFFQVALWGVSRLAKTAFANICFFGAVACVLATNFSGRSKIFSVQVLEIAIAIATQSSV